MIYIGIDPGMSVTIAIMDEVRRITFRTIHSGPKNGLLPKWLDEVNRLRVLRSRLHSVFGELTNDRVVIGLESLSYGSVGLHSRMAKIEWVIQETVFSHISLASERLFMIAPSSMKKIVTGNGRATKEEVAVKLREDFPKMPFTSSHNDTDALGVLVAAKQKYQDFYEDK